MPEVRFSAVAWMPAAKVEVAVPVTARPVVVIPANVDVEVVAVKAAATTFPATLSFA